MGELLYNGTDKCNCVKKNCERHGKCDECIAKHSTSKRYPVPYCKRPGHDPQDKKRERTRSRGRDKNTDSD